VPRGPDPIPQAMKVIAKRVQEEEAKTQAHAEEIAELKKENERLSLNIKEREDADRKALALKYRKSFFANPDGICIACR
jgi:hypothetical protein